jgi:hypothetical protein
MPEQELNEPVVFYPDASKMTDEEVTKCPYISGFEDVGRPGL